MQTWPQLHTDHSGASPLLSLKSALMLLLPLASKWQTIGTLLDIDQGKLRSIKHNEQEADDRLREMLDTWLRQTDPLPSWGTLAEVVKPFDPSIAEKIRKF